MKTQLLSALTNILNKMGDPKVSSEDAQKFGSALSHLSTVANSFDSLFLEQECPAGPAPAATAAPVATAEKAKAGRPPKATAAPAPAPDPQPAAEETQEEEAELDLIGGGETTITAFDLKCLLGGGLHRAKAEGLKPNSWATPAGQVLAQQGKGAGNVANVKPEDYNAVYHALLELPNAPSAAHIAQAKAELTSKGVTE